MSACPVLAPSIFFCQSLGYDFVPRISMDFSSTGILFDQFEIHPEKKVNETPTKTQDCDAIHS